MTCIIGYIDKKNDCTWIGGDSLGSDGFIKAVQTPSKVFRNKTFDNVVMGSTSTFRHIDLLKYSDKLFDEIDMYKKVELNHEYMVTKFIPKLITLFKEGMVCEAEIDRGANFLIGADNKLFEIQGDYSVLEPTLGFTAVGCGEYSAMGSLVTTKDMDMSIEDKIRLALESAEQNCCGVQRPFKIINTKDDKEIIIE